MPALAQDDADEAELEEIITTGTRNIERIFRDLPVTIPGDGENANNGTAGQATLDLRGLGEERMLVLMNGKRLTPYDINGQVTTDIIPVIMLERVDVVTGGASAVYGSDAMSGAVNFILRDDFEGVEVEYGWSETDSGQEFAGGGESTSYVQAMLGVNFDEDRGNVTIGGGRTDRGSVLLGEREFGVFGVSSTTGAGLGSAPAEPPPECSGNTSFTTAHATGVGSTTAIPATLNLRSGNSYQFRDNGDLILGECARFNFNPFNYYQTPQDRFNATTVGRYDISDHVTAYAMATFSSNESAFRIAPSGTFGTAFEIPVLNPFLNEAARDTIIADLIAGAATFVSETTAGIADCQANLGGTCDQDTLDALTGALAADPTGFNTVGINDLNGDGVFDRSDSFTSTSRRRTLELGARTGIYDTDYYQYTMGFRGDFGFMGGAWENWNFDASYQRGVSDFVETRDGFTNLTNLATGINTVSATECITPAGVVTDAPCSPINVFGPVGSITDQQRDDGYFIAIASDIRKSELTIWSAQVDGIVEQAKLPWAENALSLAVGVDFLEYRASSSPDECLKLAPASCQGGAGGNRLPISGVYEGDEYWLEVILPLVEGRTGIESLSLEGGYRYADYDVQGWTDSWKIGASWEIVPGLRFRAMEQQAVRVANIGELFRPITTGLDNATLDPCSIGNPNPPAPGSELFSRCLSTGMLPSQVGTAPDIISGQVNIFAGTNPNALPDPEEASTTTFGVVWEPEFDWLPGPTTISLDYYNIEIDDYIDRPTGQESLDLCYIIGDPVTCGGIVRIGGALGETGTGTPSFFTNFVTYQAEGIDFSLSSTGYELGEYGELGFNWTAHTYLTNEFQTTAASPVVDCKGFYGTSCDPVPEFRSIFRINYLFNDFDASLLWRHIDDMDAQEGEAMALFEEFRSVDSQDYFDLSFGYTWNDMVRFQALIANIADEDPPILGDNTGSTRANNGNTFPSMYDTMGRVYNLSVKVSF
jgi:outer membrane receptor protein involved in Fe transport